MKKLNFIEPLAVKFAAELIEAVAHVKKNRQSKELFEGEGSKEDVEYFMHTSAIKSLLQCTQEGWRLFIPLSVGQQYHEGAHAASQIACLQNIRDAYEQWLQQQITQYTHDASKVKCTWQVEMIVADSSQALNEIPAVDINLDESTGQCVQLLRDQTLAAYEEPYIERGTLLDILYRKLLGEESPVNQKDVKIKFEFRKDSIRWYNLKKYFQDPGFLEIVNYFESYAKFGIQRLMEMISQSEKLSTEAKRIQKLGLLDNWSEFTKVNDLCYVITEIILTHTDILKDPMLLGEKIRNGIMYPGPLQLILVSGKNILATQYNHLLADSDCVFLRVEKLNPRDETQDKNARLFSGVLCSDGSRQLPDEAHMCRRVAFIKQEMDEAVSLKVALLAMKQSAIRKEKKVAAQKKKKRDHFNEGPRAQFLNSFYEQHGQYVPIISQLCTNMELIWDMNNPIMSMINFCRTCTNVDENSDSPRLVRLLSASQDGFSVNCAENLLRNLETLYLKYEASTSNTARTNYILRAACILVECGVSVQENSGPAHPRMKRSRSIQLPLSRQSSIGLLSISGENLQCSQSTQVSVIRPNTHDRLLAGIFFFIHQFTINQSSLDSLREPDYYPDELPQINYQSTQDSHSCSVPEGGSL